MSLVLIKDNFYYISDSDDGVVDTVTYLDLYNCIVNLNMHIKGVIYCKRTGKLLCEVISGGTAKSTEFFKEEIYNLYGDDYTVLGQYTKGTVALLIRHNVCGHKYMQEPRLILSGKRCPKCFRNEKATTDSFKNYMLKTVGDDYSLLSEYTGANNSIVVRHNICGLVYTVSAASFKRGQRYPKCTKLGVPVREFKQVENLVNNYSSDYKLLEYTNSIADAKFKHLICGTSFRVKLYTFLKQGGSCPFCRTSVPEKLLQLELSKWFKCKYNYKPNWLIGLNNYRLELDVYIPSEKIAVEYDGMTFHKDRVENDIIKDNLCVENNVELIRLREYGLPRLDSSSIQIFANNVISLRHNRGLVEFETMINSLLRILGIESNYTIDIELLNRIILGGRNSK